MHKGADEAPVAWAKAEGLAVRIDRPRKWSNPFHLGRHGDRAAIIAAYREHLDHSPGLKANLGELRGKPSRALPWRPALRGRQLAHGPITAYSRNAGASM